MNRITKFAKSLFYRKPQAPLAWRLVNGPWDGWEVKSGTAYVQFPHRPDSQFIESGVIALYVHNGNGVLRFEGWIDERICSGKGGKAGK